MNTLLAELRRIAQAKSDKRYTIKRKVPDNFLVEILWFSTDDPLYPNESITLDSSDFETFKNEQQTSL